jgi:hypothetical protein
MHGEQMQHKSVIAAISLWIFLLWSFLAFATPPNQKPAIWACDPGTVAYNCVRMGLPVPKFAAPTWENGGNRLHSYTGNQVHGTASGTAWEKNGLKFSATDYVTFDDSDIWTWTPVDENRTLSFWFYPTVLPTNNANPFQFLVTTVVDATSKRHQWTFIQQGGATYLLISIAGYGWDTLGYFITPWSPSLNTWYHITLVASSATNCEIYINGIGQSVTENSWDDNTEITPTVTDIKSSTGASTGEGIVKNYLFWHDKISQTQNSVLYNNPYGMFELAPMTAWYVNPLTTSYPQVIMVY